jgi:hypothetical protein
LVGIILKGFVPSQEPPTYTTQHKETVLFKMNKTIPTVDQQFSTSARPQTDGNGNMHENEFLESYLLPETVAAWWDIHCIYFRYM